jgi:hypothetical protein
LRLPIEVALQRGHQVLLAARELHRVDEVLGGLPITVLQAPFKQDVVQADQAAFLSYTHLIGRQCFSSLAELKTYLLAWRALFDHVQPDIVFFEHSPTALVAAFAYPFRKVLVGGGFSLPATTPATSYPFLPFPTTPHARDVLERLCVDDAQLLALINAALKEVGANSMPNLDTIFSQADARFLKTWPVLDHFGERTSERYLGTAPLCTNVAPPWPSSSAPKVFGYLQNFPSLEPLLRDLQAAGVCALLFVRDLPPDLRAAYSGQSLRFIDRLVDLRQVATQVSWVVHHGNHSTMSTFMMAGVPQLVIPRQQEQLFCALRLVSAGCAAMAFQDQFTFAAAINAMQTNLQLKHCAVQVASRSHPYDLETVMQFMGQTLDNLLCP